MTNSIAKAVKSIIAHCGAIVEETAHTVSIVTFKSSNVKTGNMWQIWHLVKSVKPTEALKQGLNPLVCGTCPLQGDGTGSGRVCYANLCQGPRAVYAKYKRGGYPKLTTEMIPHVFNKQAVRFGAYGNPSLLTLNTVKAITNVTRTHTGYIHDWKTADTVYSKYFMASVQDTVEQAEANKMGYRTFRVVKSYEDNQKNEITCVSDSHGKTCLECGLCNGAGKTKNITIQVHGSGQAHFENGNK